MIVLIPVLGDYVNADLLPAMRDPVLLIEINFNACLFGDRLL